MGPTFHALRPHDAPEPAPSHGDGLHVFHGDGRNLALSLPPRWISLWLPLSGEIEMDGADCRWLLSRGEMLLWREGALAAGHRRRSHWLAIAGSPAAWALRMRPRPGDPMLELFPRQAACPAELKRMVVHVARAVRDQAGHKEGAVEAGIQQLCSALLEQQQDLHALLQRCSGRSLQRRQQTLMRLLRVQHLIRRHEDGRVELARLAGSANYSRCHLIRSYRDVFGETPSEYASRLRAERAWQLVRDTRMPVCEITEALGFESQSAFCRAFKNTWGMTTSEARLRINDDAPASRAA